MVMVMDTDRIGSHSHARIAKEAARHALSHYPDWARAGGALSIELHVKGISPDSAVAQYARSQLREMWKLESDRHSFNVTIDNTRTAEPITETARKTELRERDRLWCTALVAGTDGDPEVIARVTAEFNKLRND